MSKQNFKTVEEAVAHIETLNATIAKHEANAKIASDNYKKQEALVMKAQELASNTERDHKAALEEVATLSSKLDLQEKHGDKGVIVSIGKKSFTLEGDSFVYGGGIKTAQELSKDDAQLNVMLESKSGSLIPLD